MTQKYEINDDKPTELTSNDIDKFVQDLENGKYIIKMKQCFKCEKEHFPNYGSYLSECDECYFSRFPKEQVRQFFRSFLE